MLSVAITTYLFIVHVSTLQEQYIMKYFFVAKILPTACFDIFHFICYNYVI